MSVLKITVSSAAIEALKLDCESRYPQEACGLLIGADGMVERSVGARNVWSDSSESHRRFTLDPQLQLATEMAAQKSGKTVMGSYHSHPDHPAEPSEFDLQAAWPVYVYFIVSVVGGKAADVRAWQIDAEKQQFVELEIETFR